jgi:hypothetical protein
MKKSRTYVCVWFFRFFKNMERNSKRERRKHTECRHHWAYQLRRRRRRRFTNVLIIRSNSTFKCMFRIEQRKINKQANKPTPHCSKEKARTIYRYIYPYEEEQHDCILKEEEEEDKEYPERIYGLRGKDN